MFKHLFKKEQIHIYSPLNGEVVPIEFVPDTVFSEKMMGEGIAVIPNGGDIVAPIDGEIIQIAPTKHAIGIRGKDDTEILIHIGLDTVALKGEGFSILVEMGEKVTVGQKLMHIDWDFLKKHVEHIITPLVITNSQPDKSYEVTEEGYCQQAETILLTIK